MDLLAWKDALIGGCSVALVGVIVGVEMVSRRHAREEALKKLMSGEGENEMESASYRDEAP